MKRELGKNFERLRLAAAEGEAGFQHTSIDMSTGWKTARYDRWIVRARPAGTYDIAGSPFEGWDGPKVTKDLDLDHAARILGVPRGDLFAWAKS